MPRQPYLSIEFPSSVHLHIHVHEAPSAPSAPPASIALAKEALQRKNRITIVTHATKPDTSSYKPVKLFNFNFNLNLNLNFSIRPPRDEILFRTAIHYPVIFLNLNFNLNLNFSIRPHGAKFFSAQPSIIPIFLNLNFNLNLSTSTHASDISVGIPVARPDTSSPKTTPDPGSPATADGSDPKSPSSPPPSHLQ